MKSFFCYILLFLPLISFPPLMSFLLLMSFPRRRESRRFHSGDDYLFMDPRFCEDDMEGRNDIYVRLSDYSTSRLSIVQSLLTCLFVIMFDPITTLADHSKLPVPRFVSIKSNEVNARSGPTIKCLIEWVFIKKGEPVEIIAEYENWRQIRDIHGEGGWVHLSVLSGKRSIIVIGKEIIELTKTPNDRRNVVARVSPQVRCSLNKCTEDFCQVRCKDYKGWAPRKALWGIYPQEEIK